MAFTVHILGFKKAKAKYTYYIYKLRLIRAGQLHQKPMFVNLTKLRLLLYVSKSHSPFINSS